MSCLEFDSFCLKMSQVLHVLLSTLTTGLDPHQERATSSCHVCDGLGQSIPGAYYRNAHFGLESKLPFPLQLHHS